MHLSLPKRFPLFILAFSVCWSLQCLISILTQGARWWSLYFRLACSVVLWGGRNTANKCHRRVFIVIQPHWVCPHSRRVCFPVYTAQTLGCSAGDCLMWALVFMHFPGKPLRFMFSGIQQRRRLGWACVLRPSQVRAAQVTRSLVCIVAPC